MEIIDIMNQRWDQIVGNGLIHFTRNYCKAFTLDNDDIPILFYYEDEYTKAFQVMMKRKIETALGEFYDLISPYGYGGWMIEGVHNSSIFKEYEAICVENHIVCEFVRFDLFRTDISKYYGDLRFVSHNVVKNVGQSDELIFDDFERRVKKNIRKAIRNELEVIIDSDQEYINEFLDIYYDTMNRNDATENYYFSKDFFKEILKENSLLFHVMYQHKIISTELILYDKLCSYSFLGGTLDEYFYLRPNELLKYEIMKWSSKHGLKYFVLGGGYQGDDGIFNYKKGLSPNGIYNFYVGKYIFNTEMYEELCLEKKCISSDDYFPSYRKIR